MIQLVYFDPRNAQEKIEEELQTADALVNRLRELQSKYAAGLDAPLGVCILNGSNDSTSVGLGGAEWVLCHTHMKAGFPLRAFVILLARFWLPSDIVAFLPKGVPAWKPIRRKSEISC